MRHILPRVGSKTDAMWISKGVLSELSFSLRWFFRTILEVRERIAERLFVHRCTVPNLAGDNAESGKRVRGNKGLTLETGKLMERKRQSGYRIQEETKIPSKFRHAVL